jgi:membrane-associated phospholipid phosphatase
MGTTLAERAQRRRAPFFDERLNSRYGWPVAVEILLLAACLAAFAALAAAVTRNDFVTGWDRHLNERLQNTHSRAVELFTHLGSFWGLLAVCVVASVLLARRRAWTDITLLLASLAGAALLNPLAKHAVARPRPLFHDASVVYTTYSFPSGHTMGTTAVYAALAIILARRTRYGPLAIGGAAAMIVLIALSRIYLGAHYISDVAGGVLLGLAWVLFVVLALTIRERRRIAPLT